ncbi:MAG: hypothetical protein IT318_25685 [Anaerolineales bacterium]|nr:hypothetical protein [Anaerolineales bacterium]
MPAQSGRGRYTALLAARAQEARRRGVRYLTIDASPMSRPIVARHGFTYLTNTIQFGWHPAYRQTQDNLPTLQPPAPLSPLHFRPSPLKSE